MHERENPVSPVSSAEIESVLSYSRAFRDFVNEVLEVRNPSTHMPERDLDVFLPVIDWSEFNSLNYAYYAYDERKATLLKESFHIWCRGRPPIIIVPTHGVTKDEIKPIFLCNNSPYSIKLWHGKSYPLTSHYVIGSLLDDFSLRSGQSAARKLDLISFFERRGIGLDAVEQGLMLVLRKTDDRPRVEEMALPLPAGWEILIGPTGLNKRIERLGAVLPEIQKNEKLEMMSSGIPRLKPVRYFPKIERASSREDLRESLSQAQSERFMNLAINQFSDYPLKFFLPSAGMRGGVGRLITADGKELPVNIEYSPKEAASRKLRLIISGLKIDGERLEVRGEDSGSPCRMIIELTYKGEGLGVVSTIEEFGYRWEPCGKATMVNNEFICRLLAGIKPAKKIDWR